MSKTIGLQLPGKEASVKSGKKPEKEKLAADEKK